MKNEESEWGGVEIVNRLPRRWRRDMLASVWGNNAKEMQEGKGEYEAYIYASTSSSKRIDSSHNFHTMEEAMQWADMYILTQGIKP